MASPPVEKQLLIELNQDLSMIEGKINYVTRFSFAKENGVSENLATAVAGINGDIEVLRRRYSDVLSSNNLPSPTDLSFKNFNFVAGSGFHDFVDSLQDLRKRLSTLSSKVDDVMTALEMDPSKLSLDITSSRKRGFHVEEVGQKKLKRTSDSSHHKELLDSTHRQLSQLNQNLGFIKETLGQIQDYGKTRGTWEKEVEGLNEDEQSLIKEFSELLSAIHPSAGAFITSPQKLQNQVFPVIMKTIKEDDLVTLTERLQGLNHRCDRIYARVTALTRNSEEIRLNAGNLEGSNSLLENGSKARQYVIHLMESWQAVKDAESDRAVIINVRRLRNSVHQQHDRINKLKSGRGAEPDNEITELERILANTTMELTQAAAAIKGLDEKKMDKDLNWKARLAKLQAEKLEIDLRKIIGEERICMIRSVKELQVLKKMGMECQLIVPKDNLTLRAEAGREDIKIGDIMLVD